MAKLKKTTLFKTTAPRAETLLDKTTRAAKQILEEEKEQRQLKIARLRKARLEKMGGTPTEEPEATSDDGARKNPRSKDVR